MGGLVVLTPNPAVDVTYDVDRQLLGETVRVRSSRRAAGGKGVNVVRVLRTLGLDPLALLPLGGTTGAWVRDELRRDAVRTAVLPVAGTTRTTVTVVDGIAEPTVLTEAGPALSRTEWSALHEMVGRSCSPGDVLVVSGSFPPGTGAGDVTGVVHAAHRAGAMVVVDTSGPPLLAAASAGADILKPNAAEAIGATSTAGTAEAAQVLRRLGAKVVVVSAGQDGLYGYEGGARPWHQPAVPGVRGNPTGAGDATTAGLVAATAAGSDLRDALASAAVLGAAAVLRPTAGDVDPADLPGLQSQLPHGGRRPPVPTTTDLELP